MQTHPPPQLDAPRGGWLHVLPQFLLVADNPCCLLVLGAGVQSRLRRHVTVSLGVYVSWAPIFPFRQDTGGQVIALDPTPIYS